MMQEQEDHLHQAIGGLPLYRAPVRVWAQVEQALDQEQGRQHLNQALVDYQQALLPSPLSWEALENRLVQQQRLSAAVASLPAYTLKKDLFGRILRQVAGPKPQRSLQAYWLSGVAAAVLLVLGFFWLSRPPEDAGTVKVTYSQETLPALELAPLEARLGENDEVLGFIRENCRRLQGPCASPRFQGLLHQYLELDAATQELAGQLNRHQEQTQLVGYLVRIEKEKTEVGKKLIQYLII
jgi:hypothetical protein